MSVTPVPYEKTRFWVSSESRNIDHLVDFDWRDEKWHRPKAVCSCEECFIKGKLCKHLFFVAKWINQQTT